MEGSKKKRRNEAIAKMHKEKEKKKKTKQRKGLKVDRKE
jgi:hypothetical protein